jgi:hypothetical protein
MAGSRKPVPQIRGFMSSGKSLRDLWPFLFVVVTGCVAASGPPGPGPLGISETPSIQRSAADIAKSPPSNREIPDSHVDSIIDPRLSATERALIRTELLSLPPTRRASGFIVRTLDGKLHASSPQLLQSSMQAQEQFPNSQVAGSVSSTTALTPASALTPAPPVPQSGPAAAPNAVPSSCSSPTPLAGCGKTSQFGLGGTGIVGYNYGKSPRIFLR